MRNQGVVELILTSTRRGTRAICMSMAGIRGLSYRQKGSLKKDGSLWWDSEAVSDSTRQKTTKHQRDVARVYHVSSLAVDRAERLRYVTQALDDINRFTRNRSSAESGVCQSGVSQSVSQSANINAPVGCLTLLLPVLTFCVCRLAAWRQSIITCSNSFQTCCT